MAKYYNEFRKHDVISFFLYNNIDEEIANNYISVSYNPQGSSSEQLRVSFSYYAGEQDGSKMAQKIKKNPMGAARSSENLAQPSSYQQRQEELYRNVQTGIQDAKAFVFDMAVSVGGKHSDNGYSFTVAQASSPVSEQSRVLVFYYGQPKQTTQQAQPLQVTSTTYI